MKCEGVQLSCSLLSELAYRTKDRLIFGSCFVECETAYVLSIQRRVESNEVDLTWHYTNDERGSWCTYFINYSDQSFLLEASLFFVFNHGHLAYFVRWVPCRR